MAGDHVQLQCSTIAAVTVVLLLRESGEQLGLAQRCLDEAVQHWEETDGSSLPAEREQVLQWVARFREALWFDLEQRQ